MSLARLFWVLLCATVAVYALMVFWTLPGIADEAGGLVPFDMRPGGYDFDAARAFLTALSDTGRALYLGRQHWLDSFYPGLMAATVCLALWRLTPRAAPGWLRFGILILPWAAAGFDWLENALVRQLLLATPDAVTAQAVAAASRATLAKSVLTTIAAVVVLVLVLRRFWVRWRRRGGRG